MNLNVECVNSKISDIGFLTYLASLDFICLTETFAVSIDLSLIELKDFLCFEAQAKKLSRRGRRCGGTAVLVERKFEKYVPEVRRNYDNVVFVDA